MADTNHRFSTTYQEARAKFRAATAHLPHGALDVVEDLTIDWAWLGDPQAHRVALFTSGLHGVEGFPGSAAQLDLLAAPEGTAILFVHALNPWGMANLRRVNEDNIDLNRNFLPPGAAYAGSDSHYATCDALLNPRTPPEGLDFPYPQLAWLVLRNGYGALKNAIVGGQYDYPKGLFYGGARLAAGPRVLLPFLEEQLRGRERVVHVDLHSGLGTFGGRTLLLEGDADDAKIARVRGAFGPEVKTWDRSNADAYEIRGSLIREVERRLPGVRYDALVCEFGTWSNLKVLFALRAENRLHHWGAPRPDHPAKRALVEAFSPDHPAWRASVIAHGRFLRGAAAELLATR